MNIFLTGATGFLGGKLIQNLLKNKNHTLYVFARNIQKAAKLRQTFPASDQQRIHIVEGDITRPFGGLGEEDINWLKGKIDAIYHLAALVKFDEELREELFATNYDGTKHILDLATAIGAKKFYYVSTAYTVGKGSNGVEALYPMNHPTNNPYEESKVKSEHLVFSYNTKLDISIFRPAIIVGDSKTGEADSSFTLYGFMRALELFKRKVSRYPSETSYRILASKEGTSNLVPVDYVSDILSLAPENAKPDTIYHITNPYPPTNEKLLTFIKDALHFEQLDIVEEVEIHELMDVEKRLNELIDVYQVYLTRNLSFKDDHTKELISGTDIQHLLMTDDMIKLIIDAGVRNRQAHTLSNS
ncbi:SDR family oxidoreductase [Bacillus kexueae]|uniref:SDR family oxidoreductase n=1 Tax=Aeribacillus kexueae TaxID=2078952 RepID=UPI001FAE857D|nr:SDR family oxidoreductase [Bacillus kexueae]